MWKIEAQNEQKAFSLNYLHNYFNDPIKLFLDTLAKPFFSWSKVIVFFFSFSM